MVDARDRSTLYLMLETAGEHLCRDVPTAGLEQTVDQIRGGLMGQRFELATTVAVVEAGRLRGVIDIEDLIASAGGVRAGDLMDPAPPVVAPDENQEPAAWRAVQSKRGVLAVVDDAGKFLGLISAHSMLRVVFWEHEEDLARLGGFGRQASSARLASEEPIPRRLWHRLPWLLLGLLGAFVAADIVAAFEDQLRSTVALAFFLPGVVYLADAVGTQTEALVIRGLSLGVTVRRMLRREALTGLLVGTILAAAFLPFALWRWGDVRVALTIAIALLAASSLATLVAMLLPWGFQRFGKDPAFGSGPLATVVQDLISIAIYLSLGALIVR